MGEDEEKEKEKKQETENEQKVDPVQAKLLKLLEEVREKEERRNCYLNLAYTAPHENAPHPQGYFVREGGNRGTGHVRGYVASCISPGTQSPSCISRGRRGDDHSEG